MKSRRLWLAVACVTTLIAIASVVLLQVRSKRDLSNYTVDHAVTNRVILLFDSLGKKNEEEFVFGGGTSGKAVGPSGFSSAMCFIPRDSERESLGVHRLIGFGQDEIRFSLGDQNPFETRVLSDSLSEHRELRQSFEAMMARLERTDQAHHRLIICEVEYRKREAEYHKREAEQVMPLNRP